jgi:hypothetical protein
MITFNKIYSIFETHPGQWSIRVVLNKDGQEYESCFLKIIKDTRPEYEDITDAIDALLKAKNTPPEEPSDIHNLQPPVQVVAPLGIWARLKRWLLSWMGRG